MDRDLLAQQKNIDQRLRRQSAPKPTAQDFVAGQSAKPATDGVEAINAMTVNQPVNDEFIHRATQTLMKYKQGKANLERRIVDNERWYKLRHWECMRAKEHNSSNAGAFVDQVEPVSGWLFNCLASKHADAMDNFPMPNILPREASDKYEAKTLTSIIPVILEQNDFEQIYSDETNYKLKNGTGVYGVFWDASKLHGLGDIAVKKADILNLFWQPGVMDIQQSKHLFNVELVDNDVLLQTYPDKLTGKNLGGQTIDVAKYVYDDSVDTSDKSPVVDMYYKKPNSQGKTVLHFCKFVNEVVLFATENTPEFAERGLYDHAEYPFVFDPLYTVEGTPAGFGYVDIGKNAQEYIDRGNKAILENMLANAAPRFFVRNDGSVNEEEYADLNNQFIHVDGNLGQDSILPVQGKPLNDIYVSVINNKVDELKETTGNRDIANGGTTSGVTAASAIAAMQESGSKLSRDSNKGAYRAFRRVVILIIELIRQFYDLPRQFRITGERGKQEFIENYTNAGIRPQDQGNEFGLDMGVRIPMFDVEVSAQKQSPYSKMAQNELALQLFNAGFFNPQISDQALACLDMMDFDRKDFVIEKVSQNGTMLQIIQQLQQQMLALGAMVDQSHGGNEVTQNLLMQFQQMGVGNVQGTVGEMPQLGGDAKESSVTANARQRVADSTSPT